MISKTAKPGIKLLEITMRDVLDGLEDAASYAAYRSVPDTLEILSIERLMTAPPATVSQTRLIPPVKAAIPFKPEFNPNIVDYLNYSRKHENRLEILPPESLLSRFESKGRS